MVFDSIEFAVFFALVYAVYLCLGHRRQNVFLLGASYFFYGFWSWKFLALLVGTQLIDYQISRALERLDNPAHRRRLMWLSVAVNMGTLGFFKYFNFFTDNLAHLVNLAGYHVSDVTLNIVLPVGISFYTIQEMTYILDVYRRQVKPADRFVDFALFVSYFPQLVAGPIERAERLLPQVQQPRTIRYNELMEGGWLIFFGLFKKMFVADRLAQIVDPVFGNAAGASGPMIALAAVAFTVQIYADFSGYSDMAVGLGRLMGFRLMYNFNLPFFATSPSDFWRRWHISLSQCLRDNLYIPLGGNRRGISREMMALMVTMLIGGLWHGAQWHFVLWGAYCGALLVAERWLRRSSAARWVLPAGGHSPLAPRLGHIAVMFPLTVMGFLIFRAESLSTIGDLLTGLAHGWRAISPELSQFKVAFISLWLLILLQCLHYFTEDRFVVFRLPVPVRVMLYVVMYLYMSLGAPHDTRTFIYFQF